jgi:hypothetical protein
MKQSDLKAGMKIYNTATGKTWEVVSVNKFGQTVIMQTAILTNLDQWVKR